jgi:hypothetical protein
LDAFPATLQPWINPPLTEMRQPAVMIWSFCIAADTTAPNPPEGMVRADMEAEAFDLLDDPETNLYALPSDVEWPGGNESIWWSRR